MENLLDVCWKEEPEGHLLRRPDFWKLRSRRATAASRVKLACLQSSNRLTPQPFHAQQLESTRCNI